MKRLIFIIVLVLIKPDLSNAAEIDSIDSIYLDEMPQFYNNVKKLADKVWPGMKIGPFCAFRLNGPAFIMNHPDPPEQAKKLNSNVFIFSQTDYNLMGATNTKINGLLTAHNDYGNDTCGTVNQFYSELFHELHHIYQLKYVKNLRFDNPAILLTYPEEIRNDAIKQYEYEVLLDMVNGSPENFQENVNRFFTCRKLRRQLIDEKYIEYEKAVESAEGPAVFCEYLYMKEYSSSETDKEYIRKRFFYSLVEPAYGRNRLRARYLLTGFVQCMMLSKHVKGWQEEYYGSGQTLNDYFFSKFIPTETELPDLSSYVAKAEYFTGIEQQKHVKSLRAFESQDGARIKLVFNKFPGFKSFDPMHAEALTDTLILHTTVLKLSNGDNRLCIINHKAATSIADQIWFVKNVILFVPKDAVRFENDRLKCKFENVEIDWKMLNRSESENTLLVNLE
ncbi:MAG: hypothetical protein PVG39_26435 [Desulfobacteraceae bacterium]|jgi:hypothetical protein